MSRLALLVGMQFARPGGALVATLPQHTEVELVPEPDNPYDPNAVLVTIPRNVFGPPESEVVAAILAGFGLTFADLSERIVIGHVAATGGKPLERATATTGEDLIGTLDLSGATCGKLVFSSGGWVFIEVGDDDEDFERNRG